MKTTLIISVVLILFSYSCSCASVTCNVLSYGAKADNKTDLGEAIISAFNNCVKKASGSVLLIPAGDFLMNSTITLGGSDYTFQVDGTVTLAFNPKLGGTMFGFSHCDGITFTGKGRILGQGQLWRPNNNLSLYPGRPRLLRFETCNNCKISGVHLVNSPMFHVTVIGNNNDIGPMTVTADIVGETDAFDISGNNNFVHDVHVTNGDECVTVKTPTNGFRAINIFCNFTAGCNTGSFGNGPTVADVQNVYYENVTMVNSEAGAQIKTYPNNNGVVKNITYNKFNLVNVDYPISINLYWCPHTVCPAATGSLTIENVNFVDFKGTEATNSRPAVLLDCLPKFPCKHITFSEVQISAKNGATHDTIENACGSGRGSVPSCLSKL